MEIVLPLGFADAIFRRERSDGRKCVCASQASTTSTIASLCSSILLPPNLRLLMLGYWFATSSQTHTELLKVPERILKVYFEGTPLVVVYVIYAPTDVANNINKEAFFKDLHESLSKEQPQSFDVVLGKFNGSTGLDSHQQNSQIIGRYTYKLETTMANGWLIYSPKRVYWTYNLLSHDVLGGNGPVSTPAASVLSSTTSLYFKMCQVSHQLPRL